MKNGKDDTVKLTPMMGGTAELPDDRPVMVIEGPVAIALGQVFMQLNDLQVGVKALSAMILDMEARLEDLGKPAGDHIRVPKHMLKGKDGLDKETVDALKDLGADVPTEEDENKGE